MVQPMSGNNETKQKLIGKAYEIFKHGGYEQTTIEQICEASGISKNTYYYYFKSKEDLLLACIGEYENLSSRCLADILLSGESYFEQLWLVQKQGLNFIRSVGIDFFRELKNLHSLRNVLYSRNWQDDFEVKVAIVRKAQEAGEIRNQAEARGLALATGVVFLGILAIWVSAQLKFDLEKVLRSCLENTFDLRPDLRRGEDLCELVLPIIQQGGGGRMNFLDFARPRVLNGGSFMRRWGLFLLSLLCAAGLAGELSVLTLDDALDYALKHSPRHKIIYKDREISKSQARQGYAAVLPQLSLGRSETTAQTPQPDLDPAMQAMLGGGNDETKTQVEEFSGQQLLFSFSGLAAAGASWSAEKLASYVYADAREQFLLSVRKAFFDLQAAESMRLLATDMTEQLETYARNAEIMFANGVIARKDLLDVRIQLYGAQKNLTNVQKAAAAARYGFNTMLGLPVQQDTRLVTYNVEIAGGLGRQDWDAAALTKAAYRLRPSYLALQEAVWLAQVDHFNSWGSSLPAVYYVYNKRKTSYDPESMLSPSGETETQTISAQWNFFAGGANWFKIHEKANSSDKQKEQLKLAQDSLLAEIQGSLDDVKALAQNVLLAQEEEALAEESLRIARVDFESGNGTATQFNDALIQRQSAGNNLIRALYDYEYARARLNYAAGQNIL
ncbi:type I secretion outer membrane protein TolC [Candidatus Termititenax persephonae]|uniref:Type I secretion outer membrane protein TolC n=1 Tax=Candidatus Termititenax persephonae TaxID=2218525 RepID=A0A388TFK7_9BACT|nr:type I secretion outer membrane protein TolC [Candidatus Termititenax persephonae]